MLKTIHFPVWIKFPDDENAKWLMLLIKLILLMLVVMIAVVNVLQSMQIHHVNVKIVQWCLFRVNLNEPAVINVKTIKKMKIYSHWNCREIVSVYHKIQRNASRRAK